MMIRRRAFDAVGGMDERFFLYWEDADLCKRLRDAGLATVYHPGPSVTHHCGRSGGASLAVHHCVSPQRLPVLSQAHRRARAGRESAGLGSRSPCDSASSCWSEAGGQRAGAELTELTLRVVGGLPGGPGAGPDRPGTGVSPRRSSPGRARVAGTSARRRCSVASRLRSVVIGGGLTIEPVRQPGLDVDLRDADGLRGSCRRPLNLKSSTKLVFQIVLASVFVYAGHRLQWTNSLTIDTLLTLVWIVGITNALNLLDNMDGLAAGVGMVACVSLLVTLVGDTPTPEAQLLAIAAGSPGGVPGVQRAPGLDFHGRHGKSVHRPGARGRERRRPGTASGRESCCRSWRLRSWCSSFRSSTRRSS